MNDTELGILLSEAVTRPQRSAGREPLVFSFKIKLVEMIVKGRLRERKPKDVHYFVAFFRNAQLATTEYDSSQINKIA